MFYDGSKNGRVEESTMSSRLEMVKQEEVEETCINE